MSGFDHLAFIDDLASDANEAVKILGGLRDKLAAAPDHAFRALLEELHETPGETAGLLSTLCLADSTKRFLKLTHPVPSDA